MNKYLRAQYIYLLCLPFLLFDLTAIPVYAAEVSQEERIRKLEKQVELLFQHVEQKDEEIQKLKSRLEQFGQQSATQEASALSPQEELDAMVQEVENRPESKERSLLSSNAGNMNLRLIDVSAIINVSGGSSTANSDEIEKLQGGGHDPKRRGFTFQQLELSVAGAVDPYFVAEAHMIWTEEHTELEEAFATTTCLPWGLQLEAGLFLTEFGRINPTHPHTWYWLDQPVVNTRMFGADGMRGTGFRLGWLTPLPWFSELHFGIQDPRGAAMPSFNGQGLEHSHDHGHGGGQGIAGRTTVDRDVRKFKDLVYLMRWTNGFDLSDTLSVQLGGSMLYGPNNTGSDGDTWIYGADLVVKWRPHSHKRGWPFISWQTEIIKRDYYADHFFSRNVPRDSHTLHDWGMYTQLMVGLRRPWAAGVRFEYATGQGKGFEDGRFIDHDHDPFRDERCRISPLLMWQATEFSRIRLQYNYDWAEHIKGHDEHSVWCGLEFLFGSHPAHNF